MKKQFTLLTLIFLIAACGGNSDKNSESFDDNKKESKNKVELKSDNGSITIDGEDGKMVMEGEDGSKVEVNVGEGQSVPDGFPKDIVPIYKDAKILATSKNYVDEKESFLISFGSDDSVDDITNFYKSKFSKKEIKTNMNMNGMSMLAIEKDGFTISIQILPAEDDEYGKSAANITVINK